jgi:hypothetical protein
MDQTTYSSRPSDDGAETVICCSSRSTTSDLRRFTIGDETGEVRLTSAEQGCLGDNQAPCISTRTAVGDSANSLDSNNDQRRADEDHPRRQHVLDSSADNPNKRARVGSNLKTKKQDDDQDFSYEVGFDSEQDRSQSQLTRQMQVRQSDDTLGGPGRNWRSNMMRVWGRRRR